MYGKILVTTDGSELARSAIQEVPRLAGSQSEVVVVEVIELAEQRQPAIESLQKLEARLHAAGIAHVRTEVLAGVPGPTIVEYAMSDNFDIIVIATHGRTGLVRALLGSVAEYVAHHTEKAPVLLVRSRDQ